MLAPPIAGQPVRLPAIPVHHQWGVFCIGEYRLQQKTGVPLYLRLGSLEQVNRLEGKPGYRMR